LVKEYGEFDDCVGKCMEKCTDDECRKKCELFDWYYDDKYVFTYGTWKSGECIKEWFDYYKRKSGYQNNNLKWYNSYKEISYDKYQESEYCSTCYEEGKCKYD
jgi:hypothetical protein